MKLIILGAGGHGQVVADLARQAGRYEEVLFLDDKAEGSDVVGICADYVRFQNQDVEMYPAFGNNPGRIQWENKILDAGITLAAIIHPLAYVIWRLELL